MGMLPYRRFTIFGALSESHEVQERSFEVNVNIFVVGLNFVTLLVTLGLHLLTSRLCCGSTLTSPKSTLLEQGELKAPLCARREG